MFTTTRSTLKTFRGVLLCHSSLYKWQLPFKLSKNYSPTLSIRYLSQDVVRAIKFSPSMVDYLNAKQRRYCDLENQMAQATKLSNNELAELGKEFADLGPLITLLQQREEAIKSIQELVVVEKEEAGKGAEGEEMVQLAREEKAELEVKLQETDQSIVKLLIPKDKDDDRNIILEVRAGTGGDEASLFAGEVFKMYHKYSLFMHWKWEELSLSKTEIGGFKEAQALISGSEVYKHLKFESGVHRVQRIPINDTKIHTSAASVIVMPEAGDLDIDIKQSDIRVDVFRSGGAGGQSVNKTESAVRMTHIPTGVVVVMQDERSQIQNRVKALKVLRARVYDMEKMRMLQARSEMRSAAHGTGDRSDKIRTYNFPQDRVTDHRAGVTVPSVERVMNGEQLNTIIDKLQEVDEQDKLNKLIEQIG